LSLLPPDARVLDFAAGAGRHARYAADAGLRVTAADRQVDGLRDMAGRVTVIEADLEADPWPFDSASYDAVIVSNFLHRPRLTELMDLVAPGGWLIYQTFGEGNAHFGRPRNPDFLLKPGELFEVTSRAGLVVAGYESGLQGKAEGTVAPVAVVQRVAAWRPTPADGNDPRVPLLP
jgi:SAM-dependent methyltransferase